MTAPSSEALRIVVGALIVALAAAIAWVFHAEKVKADKLAGKEKNARAA